MGDQRVSDVYGENIRWQDTVPGASVSGGGTSREVTTGEWRVNSPEYLEDKCRQCLLCVPVCPDSAIPVQDGKRGAFNMLYCKGCGICAKVCPFGAIEMRNGGDMT